MHVVGDLKGKGETVSGDGHDDEEEGRLGRDGVMCLE